MSDIYLRCVYCFNEFWLLKPSDVVFRAKAPVKRLKNLSKTEKIEPSGKDMLRNIGTPSGPGYIGNADGKEIDEKLKDFFVNKMGDFEENAKQKALRYPCFCLADGGLFINLKTDYHTNKEYISEIILNPEYYSSSQASSNERVCPHCHKTLPTGFGSRDIFKLSVIGDTNSGKTVYLAVFLHELIYGGSGGSLQEIGGEDDDVKQTGMEANINKLYDQWHLPDATPPTVILPPLLYNYTYKYLNDNSEWVTNSIDIALYDIAGENCRDKDKMKKAGFYVEHSDGVIFLLNPLAIDQIKLYYKTSEAGDGKDGEIDRGDTSTKDQVSVINAIFKDFLRENSDIPIACVMTKVDVLSSGKMQIPYIVKHPHSRILTHNAVPKGYNDFPDKEDLDDLSEDVYDFLNSMGAKPFVSFIELNFRHHSFFAVSALNQEPIIIFDNDKEKDAEKDKDEREYHFEITKEIEPFRINDPFYWLLAQKDFLNIKSKTLPSQMIRSPKEGLIKRIIKWFIRLLKRKG